jgi:hypothetical protein
MTSKNKNTSKYWENVKPQATKAAEAAIPAWDAAFGVVERERQKMLCMLIRIWDAVQSSECHTHEDYGKWVGSHTEEYLTEDSYPGSVVRSTDADFEEVFGLAFESLLKDGRLVCTDTKHFRERVGKDFTIGQLGQYCGEPVQVKSTDPLVIVNLYGERLQIEAAEFDPYREISAEFKVWLTKAADSAIRHVSTLSSDRFGLCPTCHKQGHHFGHIFYCLDDKLRWGTTKKLFSVDPDETEADFQRDTLAEFREVKPFYYRSFPPAAVGRKEIL